MMMMCNVQYAASTRRLSDECRRPHQNDFTTRDRVRWWTTSAIFSFHKTIFEDDGRRLRADVKRVGSLSDCPLLSLHRTALYNGHWLLPWTDTITVDRSVSLYCKEVSVVWIYEASVKGGCCSCWVSERQGGYVSEWAEERDARTGWVGDCCRNGLVNRLLVRRRMHLCYVQFLTHVYIVHFFLLYST